ncbi:MAG TPA: Rid family detoxifying hydrolase [Symbiobacteriaceae bacterium]|nr:Rid family detoxifying hydrolase [Symbiobacteriaceae bacterium]
MIRKIAVHPATAPAPIGPYSPAIIAGDFVFVSGQGPLLPGTRQALPGGVREQTAQVLENIRAILTAAGCTMADVVKVTAHLADMKDFAEYNEVYQHYFPEPYPARTTVQSGLPGPFSVEIDVIALRPHSDK